MCKLIAATAAFAAVLAVSMGANAADLPPRPAPAPVYAPPPFIWTGFYLGGNIGGAWAHRDVTDNRFGLDFGRSSDGVFIGGGQLGYNYQTGNFVLGIEWDTDGAGNNDNNGAGVIVPGVGTLVVRANDTWITTLAARFGVANGQWLFYGKAGGGWIGHNNFTVTNVTTGTSITGGNDHSNSGFLIGVGAEWAFANNWSAKIEYDFLGLGSRTFVVPAGSPFLAGDTFTTSSRNIQMVKAGINYLFNWGGPRM
jgi:outer membrane immunogenic protein